MFTGQPGGWTLPWNHCRERDHHPRLWDDHAGQADREARGSDRECEDSQEDHRHADDDRSQAGLRGRRRGDGRIWSNQWGTRVIKRTAFLNARGTISIESGPAGIQAWFGSAWRCFRSLAFPYTWVLLLLLLIPLEDTRPGSAQAGYEHA